MTENAHRNGQYKYMQGILKNKQKYFSLSSNYKYLET